MKRTNLKRKTPLRRGTTRIKPVSARRAAALVIYTEAREQFLRENPLCEVRRMPGCTQKSQDVHHRLGRLDGNLFEPGNMDGSLSVLSFLVAHTPVHV